MYRKNEKSQLRDKKASPQKSIPTPMMKSTQHLPPYTLFAQSIDETPSSIDQPTSDSSISSKEDLGKVDESSQALSLASSKRGDIKGNVKKKSSSLKEEEDFEEKTDVPTERQSYTSSRGDILDIRKNQKRVPILSVAPAIRRPDPISEIRQIATELRKSSWSDELKNQLFCLGNVSLRKESYFEQTKDSNNCVKEFFKTLVQQKEILNEVENLLHQKQQYLSSGNDNVWPGCITFLTCTLYDKNVCFIALSRDSHGGDKKLLDLLDNLAKDLNKYQKARNSKYFYAVVMDTSKSFKRIINALSRNTRTCAEYDMGSLLSKLYMEYGASLQIEGCSNAFLFNYKKETEVEYQKDMRGRTLAKVSVRDDYNASVNKRSKNVELAIGFGQKVTLIPCCSVCQNNKWVFLAALINFQQEGEKFRQVQGNNDIIPQNTTGLEQTPATEKKSRRLSSGINGLTGISMFGFLSVVNQDLIEQEKDDGVEPIPVYS